MPKKKDQSIEARFRVIDTGIGIAPHNISKIFSPYIQADDSVHRFYGGTGLGLSIAKKIIELQGGTIQAVSEEGKGTTITFSLSWTEGEAPPPASDLPATTPTFRQIRHVLVGEDDLMSQKVLEQLLARWGLKATVADDGIQVLQKLQQHSYDLLIVDHQMPGLSGKEVIQSLPEGNPLPIIMLSGDIPQTEQLHTTSTIVFLKKPVTPALLLQEIMMLDQTSSPTKVSLNYLREITGNDPALMVDLIDTFIQQVPREITKMKKALREKDWPALYLAVHKSKPNFNYVGVRSIQGMLDQFEHEVEQRTNQSAYQQRIKELEAFTKQIVPALEAEKKNLWNKS